ncbi:hypothetical protein EX30DRAFT_349759 [Ascodesmis nigricans]|uniref:Uncharacterized protein n=1 Tax=Ascodesmis nigricans TaxID=341454 RepID=A0A4S2MU77_9PEZI|nr:hypothetical protein EX30DRAFT_349759 [Ascodesmis nigricans]
MSFVGCCRWSRGYRSHVHYVSVWAITLCMGLLPVLQAPGVYWPAGRQCSTDLGDTKITVTTPNGIHTAPSGDAVSITGNQGMPLPQPGLPTAPAPGQPSRYYEQQPQPQRWGHAEGVYGPYGQVQTPGQHPYLSGHH